MQIYPLIQLLRIPISYYLSPVFLFAFSMANTWNYENSIFLFIALHLFIYPASNAYNSFMDQDESSITGLKNPPKAGKGVLYVSILFDFIGLWICYYLSAGLCYAVLVYVLVSRMYSWHGIRLKKYAFLSFISVVFFQGAYIFTVVYVFCQNISLSEAILQENFSMPALISSLIVAGKYPLSQVYKHKSDAKAGVHSFSMWLGIKGTFEFSSICFVAVALLMGYHFIDSKQSHLFYVFIIFMFPIVAYFLWWTAKIWYDPKQVNYRYTMLFNKFAASFLNLYFISVFVIKNFPELPI